MNIRQKSIIRAFQWVLYPIAAVLLIAFVADFLDMGSAGDGSPAPRTEAVLEFLGPVESIIFLLMAALFWVVFVALLVEFVSREIFRRQTREGLGKPLIEMYEPALAVRFVLPIAALVFVAGFNVAVFTPDLAPVEWSQPTLEEQMLFWLFYGIAHFLLVAFTLRAVRNRPYFVLTERGFLYEPGDISPGLIRWEDVAGIEETALLSGNGTVSGPTTRGAIVVALRDPQKYARAYTPLLRLMNMLAMRVVSLQTGGPASLVLAAEDFGDRYEAVVREMRQRAGAAIGRR